MNYQFITTMQDLIVVFVFVSIIFTTLISLGKQNEKNACKNICEIAIQDEKLDYVFQP